MSSTRNTKTIEEIHEAWAREHGYRSKHQAPSVRPEDLHAQNSERFIKLSNQPVRGKRHKRQAPSSKRQA